MQLSYDSMYSKKDIFFFEMCIKLSDIFYLKDVLTKLNFKRNTRNEKI